MNRNQGKGVYEWQPPVGSAPGYKRPFLQGLQTSGTMLLTAEPLNITFVLLYPIFLHLLETYFYERHKDHM